MQVGGVTEGGPGASRQDMQLGAIAVGGLDGDLDLDRFPVLDLDRFPVLDLDRFPVLDLDRFVDQTGGRSQCEDSHGPDSSRAENI